jgi:hypothetical protein
MEASPLDIARQHVHDGQAQIARQRDIVTGFERLGDGERAERAREVLHALEECHARLVAVCEALAKAQPGGAYPVTTTIAAQATTEPPTA